MSKYVLEISKKGLIKYTSHLDMMRLFKRTFRRIGIDIAYSQGFNPHPKLGFSVPLSLGYESEGEYLEVETVEPVSKEMFTEDLTRALPGGLTVLRAGEPENGKKSLAALAEAAEYTATYPVSFYRHDFPALLRVYMEQPEILAMKKQKKTKKLKEVNIRDKIRSLRADADPGGHLVLTMVLDSGSGSSLSPELVIESFGSFAGLDIPRYMIEVCRKQIIFPLDVAIRWM